MNEPTMIELHHQPMEAEVRALRIELSGALARISALEAPLSDYRKHRAKPDATEAEVREALRACTRVELPTQTERYKSQGPLDPDRVFVAYIIPARMLYDLLPGKRHASVLVHAERLLGRPPARHRGCMEGDGPHDRGRAGQWVGFFIRDLAELDVLGLEGKL